MDKTKALMIAVAFVAGAGTGTAISQPARPNVELVNIKLSRGEPLDGGEEQWRVRTCAYETRARERVAEPCWTATVSGVVVGPLERALLSAQPK